jgi:hypothetical protein
VTAVLVTVVAAVGMEGPVAAAAMHPLLLLLLGLLQLLC